jgi:ankyrin repeat protein
MKTRLPFFLALFFFLLLVLGARHVVAQVPSGPQVDLFQACMKCDLVEVTRAIDGGADVNALHSSGQNALALAFFCPDVTRYLLGKGCDPNGGSYPALIAACNNYSIEVVKMLLDAGADPNKAGEMRVDPGAGIRQLIEAEKGKGKQANKVLIETWEKMLPTMKPTVTTVYPVLITVQQTNCVPCLDMLLARGADASGAIHRLAAFSMTRQERSDAFAKGAATVESFGLKVPDWYRNLSEDRNGTETDMLGLLVKRGADVNQADTEGYTPLVVALRAKKTGLAKALLAAGADPKRSSRVVLAGKEVEYIPINLAAEIGDVEILKTMLGTGADINANATSAALSAFGGTWGGDGYTPLIISIMSDRLEAAKYLLEQGADIKTGSNGYSIIEASFNEKIKCTVSVTNKTPIYWAVEKNSLELVEAIAKKMTWEFNPDFTIKVIAGGGEGFICVKEKKKIRPSAYAGDIGNKEAKKLLSDKGL